MRGWIPLSCLFKEGYYNIIGCVRIAQFLPDINRTCSGVAWSSGTSLVSLQGVWQKPVSVLLAWSSNYWRTWYYDDSI